MPINPRSREDDMKCNTDCPMDALRAIGRACQFKNMKDEDNSCIKADVDAYVEAERKRQGKPPGPYHDESEVLADELGLNRDNGDEQGENPHIHEVDYIKGKNGGEPDISDMGNGQIGTPLKGVNRW
jgi:hypothetical protein